MFFSSLRFGHREHVLDILELRKRSSISYKLPFHGLPSLELTPTAETHLPIGSEFDWSHHVSLVNERHFLYSSRPLSLWSHAFQSSERTLLSCSQPRPVSFVASDSSLSDAEPSDEMLHFIANLKAERDELRRYIDGWYMLVADLEKQSWQVHLALPVDTEHHGQWIAHAHLSVQAGGRELYCW